MFLLALQPVELTIHTLSGAFVCCAVGMLKHTLPLFVLLILRALQPVDFVDLHPVGCGLLLGGDKTLVIRPVRVVEILLVLGVSFAHGINLSFLGESLKRFLS